MCILCGEYTGDDYFCHPCWVKLPSEVKFQFWRFADYGAHRALTDEEVEQIVKLAKVDR